MLAAGCAVFLLVVALLAYVAFRRKARDSTATAETVRSAKRWIIAGGVVLPVVVLVPLFIASVSTLQSLMHDDGDYMTIHVTGRQWWWQVRYKGTAIAGDVIAANEIHVPAGRRVRVEVATADVIHSLWIPNLQGKTDLVPGRVNVMWIEANRPGVSRAQCAEYCGTQHARMALPVVAEPQAAFDAWLARERLPASPPADPAARMGSAVFISAGCGTCHTIRGSTAGGTRGPDLTHFASRRTIAAGTLSNTRANLTAWLADPQAVKPGNKMPRVPLTSQQVSATVSYLETLR